MRSGFRVGSLFGIDVYIDWSWLLIFVLVVWSLSASVFPTLHPEWGTQLNLVVSISAALLFFGSVLAHELAHSLVAKARGLPVRRITLFIFGGVSNIEKEPPSPGTEFLVAIVGPLTSALIGILFLLIAGVLTNGSNLNMGVMEDAIASLTPLSTIFGWLGGINLLLAVFNMIPGFPMDGGRVLRSILWAITRNLRRASRWATAVGQAIAWLFILTGVAMIFGFQVPILGSGTLNGLWLAFIGWFLNNAANQAYRQVVIEDVLEGVPVSRLMRADAPTVPPGISISQMVDDYLMRSDERSFPVVQGDSLLGLITLDDVRKIPRSDWDTTQVQNIMTDASNLETTQPSEDAVDALHRLSSHDYRQMPVMQDGRLVGMLRRRDILRWLRLQSNVSG